MSAQVMQDWLSNEIMQDWHAHTCNGTISCFASWSLDVCTSHARLTFKWKPWTNQSTCSMTSSFCQFIECCCISLKTLETLHLNQSLNLSFIRIGCAWRCKVDKIQPATFAKQKCNSPHQCVRVHFICCGIIAIIVKHLLKTRWVGVWQGRRAR